MAPKAPKVYNKLVRDHIPEIIEAAGKKCVCETLSAEQYITMLDTKLNEELPSGSLFDCRSGHILQTGGKAYAGNNYYLLQIMPLYSVSRDIEATKLASVQTNR